MNVFDAVACVWLASAAIVISVGYFRGRVAEAMNLGIFLGPVGVPLAFVLFRPSRANSAESVRVVPISRSNRHRQAADASAQPLRRAA
jgi:hypothetical protein